MTVSLALDLLLAAGLLWSAAATMLAREPIRAVVQFIVLGLMMTLTWVRLSAPDVALAEAAIGAGLTGAMLLHAIAGSEHDGAGS